MQLHIFRYIDEHESCEGSYGASAHHSGICWCIERNQRNWVYPAHNHQSPGEGYFVMPVRETETIFSGQFCGTDEFQFPSRHVYASPSSTGLFQHFVNCWCTLDITVRTPIVELMPVDWQYKYLSGSPETVDLALRTAYELQQPGRGRNAAIEAGRARLHGLVDQVAAEAAARAPLIRQIGQESELPAVVLAAVQSDEVLCEILERRISPGTPFYRCGCGWIGFNPQAAEHQNAFLRLNSDDHTDWESARDVPRALQLISEAPIQFRSEFYSAINAPGSSNWEPAAIPPALQDGFHVLRPATARDQGYNSQSRPTQEAHSAECWCYQRMATSVGTLSNIYYIRRVRAEEMPTILGRPFGVPTLHYYIIDPSDGEHLHDANCWCTLNSGRPDQARVHQWNELFQLAPDWTRRIESDADAQRLTQEYRIDESENHDDDDYDDDEREQVNPIDRFALRVRIPEGARRERHLLRPSDEELRHTSACWCMAEPGLTGQWRAMSDYGNEHVFEITPDDYSQIVGRPFGAYNPLHMFVSRGDEEEHFVNCWCRIIVPHEGVYVGDIPDGRVYFRLRRTPASDMGLQGERACFVCGWTALSHELTRTKKGLRLKCPDVKNPDMRNLNLTRPQVSQ